MLAAFDGKCFRPESIESLARIGLDDESALALAPAVRREDKGRTNFFLVARRFASRRAAAQDRRRIAVLAD